MIALSLLQGLVEGAPRTEVGPRSAAGHTFADVLDRATRNQTEVATEKTASEKPAASRVETKPREADPEPKTEPRERDQEHGDAVDGDGAAPQPQVRSDEQDAHDDRAAKHDDGEHDQAQPTALQQGKSPAAPTEATPADGNDHGGAVPQQQGATSPAAIGTQVASAAAAPALPPNQAPPAAAGQTATLAGAGEIAGPGITDAPARADATPTTHAPGATPRFDAQLLQTAEAAKSSIFKQIALKLAPGGGEMRLQLDPPELGHVDLHMVVEDGAMRLHIVADRPEIAHLVQRHVGELQAALADQGIALTETSVGARDGRHDQQAPDDRSGAWQDHDPEPLDSAASHAARGFVVGEGLNFLV